ncbi:hypothetical protein QFZ35_002572 [Arthrobacter ulcerisalmonis]|nr:hypothetical protein [Arthrobacter ulcerisalmonis]
MTSHPYIPFVQWTVNTYFRGSWDALDISASPTIAWLRAFGITAGRVDRFLRIGHPCGCSIPNSLVLDILELSHSPVSQTLQDEFLQCLLRTWMELTEVYGQTAVPSDREVNRLELLAEWGHALRNLPGSHFPGGCSLLMQYRYERSRLDLTQLRRSKVGFKYVGIVLELMKIREQIIGRDVLAPSLDLKPAPRPIACRKTPPSINPPKRGPRNCGSEDDHLPCLPTSRMQRMDPSACLDYELNGIWRDHWRSTLR